MTVLCWTSAIGTAFDGDLQSMWLAGEAPAPQWIELDLGREATVTGVRLLTWQDTQGSTDHRVTVRSGAGTEQEVARFAGDTTDGQWLTTADALSFEHARYVRITTLATPSMIGWREIDVSVGADTAPGPLHHDPLSRQRRDDSRDPGAWFCRALG